MRMSLHVSLRTVLWSLHMNTPPLKVKGSTRIHTHSRHTASDILQVRMYISSSGPQIYATNVIPFFTPLSVSQSVLKLLYVYRCLTLRVTHCWHLFLTKDKNLVLFALPGHWCWKRSLSPTLGIHRVEARKVQRSKQLPRWMTRHATVKKADITRPRGYPVIDISMSVKTHPQCKDTLTDLQPRHS